MGTNPLFHDAANSVDFALCFFQMAVLGVLVPRAGGGRFLDSARLVVWHVCVIRCLPAPGGLALCGLSVTRCESEVEV